MNTQYAEQLREAARLLEQQQANRFRVRAYRRGASTLEKFDQDVAEIVSAGGPDALMRLPNIGNGIASAVAEMVRTGRWSQLERLRGSLDPVEAMQAVPYLGPKLAQRIHDELDVDSLEALENAAHDGTLQNVSGIGPRRAAAFRASLGAMLRRRPRRRRQGSQSRPGVALILDVDREYREKAHADKLPTLAPRRFNPSHEAWLPILHTQRGEWDFTVLYSNSARAHALNRTNDWVVVFFYDGQQTEGQNTVVTETYGTLEGQRVVRGRESEFQALGTEREKAA